MKPGPTKMTPEVIDAINEELAYQDRMAGTDRADFVDYGVAGQLVTLSIYTHAAQSAWTGTAGEASALDQLRKCAAISIRALVKYGCPKR